MRAVYPGDGHPLGRGRDRTGVSSGLTSAQAPARGGTHSFASLGAVTDGLHELRQEGPTQGIVLHAGGNPLDGREGPLNRRRMGMLIEVSSSQSANVLMARKEPSAPSSRRVD